MKLRWAGNTDVGRKRKHNEDNFVMIPEHNMFVVADGMGGHNAGEVASEITVRTMASFFKESIPDKDYTWPFKGDPAATEETNRLVAGVKLSNLRIYEAQASDIQKKGMGTTVVALVFDDDKHAVTGHAGDSRIYRIRGDEIEQVTEDHSLLNNYKKIAKLTEEEIKNFPHKNVIVRALGMKADVDVEVNRYPLEPGDIFLLCSDGLTDEVEDPYLLDKVVEHRDNLEACVDSLIKLALENGGRDNVTIVLACYEGE
jgi:PPM family protein phosphatase